MADRLYPPIIDSKLPPLIGSTQELDGISKIVWNINIPFKLTGLVQQEDIKGFSIKISESQSNQPVSEEPFQVLENKYSSNKSYIDFDNNIIYIQNQEIPSSSALNFKTFYKIQIAAIALDNTVGFYSTYGVLKCLNSEDFSVSIIEIDELSEKVLTHLHELTGKYETKDLSETLTKYEFNIYNNGVLVESSGVQIHNNSNENNSITSTSRIGLDTFLVTTELESFQTYDIEYIVYTVNGFIKKYYSSFSMTDLFPLRFAADITAEMDDENSCAKVFVQVNNLFGRYLKASISMAGQYQLFRSSSKTNFKTWEHIFDFQLPNLKFKEEEEGVIEDPRKYLVYIDYLLEQGLQYKYAISASFNEGKENEQRSPKVIMSDEDILYANFETAYLYDKEFQLAIKYNPKVSSLKTTKLEQKADTLGGVYPYFSRNYNTNYKEFPISGLISLLMDDQQLFDNGILAYTKKLKNQYNNDSFEDDKPFAAREQTPSKENEYIQNYSSTDLVGENFKKERDFKLKVLDWLNNGELKVFKSPGEGNYIVRLMNVSLSPNDTLGRMLHTFNCTAYEAAPYTLKDLIANNLFSIDDEIIDGVQVYLEEGVEVDGLYIFDLSKYKSITKIEFRSFAFGTELKGYLQTKNNIEGQDEHILLYSFDETSFSITQENFDIKDIKTITATAPGQILIYTTEFENSEFDFLEAIKYDKIVIKQYISETYNGSFTSNVFLDKISDPEDVLNPLTDDKQQSTYIQKLRIATRPIIEAENYNFELDDLKHYSERHFPNPLCLYKDNNDNYWSQDIYGVVHKYSSLGDTIKINDSETETWQDGEYENLKNIIKITLPISKYIELSYPVNRIIYTSEQKWRDIENIGDQVILCGWQFDKDLNNNEEVINENKIVIGLNCYNFIDAADYLNGGNEQKEKTRQDGKYFSDRSYILESIEQTYNEEEQKGI